MRSVNVFSKTSLKFIITLCIQSVSNRRIHILKRYFSTTKWGRNTIYAVFYSWDFLRLIHLQNVHLLSQYTPNYDVEPSYTPSGLLSVELLFLPHRPFNTSCTIPLTSNLSWILVIVSLSVVVVCQIQPSNVVELQKHSPLSNNTLVTTYVHRMIISPPYLFKQMNDGRVAMLSSASGSHTTKFVFPSHFLLRNNISKSVYINFRQTVVLHTDISK